MESDNSMQIKDYKSIIVFGFVLAIYFFFAFSNEVPFNENMLYSLFMYCLGVYLFMPIVTGKPIKVPYSGNVLVQGKDTILRGIFSIIFLFIAMLGLSFVF